MKTKISAALAVVGLASAGLTLTASPALSADSVTETFQCTGATQSWTVPDGVTSATFELLGAAGADNSGFPGGSGGQAEATVDVTPGESIEINVGCLGDEGDSLANGGGGAGGFPDGGDGGDPNGAPGLPFAMGGSGGGGSSDIRQGGSTLADRVLVAGGGGAAGPSSNGQGGAGGGDAGTGGADNANSTASGGGGATGTTPGTAGTPNASAGALGAGGDGGTNPGVSSGIGGSGGGGGLAGGGGGGSDPSGFGGASGGGGSGLCALGCSSFLADVNAGDGAVLVTYVVDDAPVDPDPTGPAATPARPVTGTPAFTG